MFEIFGPVSVIYKKSFHRLQKILLPNVPLKFFCTFAPFYQNLFSLPVFRSAARLEQSILIGKVFSAAKCAFTLIDKIARDNMNMFRIVSVVGFFTFMMTTCFAEDFSPSSAPPASPILFCDFFDFFLIRKAVSARSNRAEQF